MNVITLTGNAVKDIEIKITPNGKAVGNGTIAVRRDFKNQNGEYETDFINFVALGKTGEIMADHIHKGDKFGITGRLQIRKWEKDNGEKQYFTEVLVNGFDFPNKPNTNGQQNNSSQGQQKPNSDPFSGGTEIDDSQLPF
jgi:single-strand DNA-binding protein